MYIESLSTGYHVLFLAFYYELSLQLCHPAVSFSVKMFRNNMYTFNHLEMHDTNLYQLHNL